MWVQGDGCEGDERGRRKNVLVALGPVPPRAELVGARAQDPGGTPGPSPGQSSQI